MTTYAIVAQRGCWGSVTRSENSIIARVDNASSQSAALEKFKATNKLRQEYKKEFKAVPLSKLNSEQKDWVVNYCFEALQ